MFNFFKVAQQSFIGNMTVSQQTGNKMFNQMGVLLDITNKVTNLLIHFKIKFTNKRKVKNLIINFFKTFLRCNTIKWVT